MHLPKGLRALGHRDYRLFFGGQLISLCGTWMQSVGQSWLILQLTDSPFKLGLIGTLQFAPMLLFGLVGGAIADRLPKRRLLIVTQSILMLLAFILSALNFAHVVQYWHVAVLATCLGIVNTFDLPARQAFVVEMVGKEDLVNAIALNSAMFNSARLVGPGIAGLLVAWKGVGPAFLINGISFVAVIAALLAMRAEGLPRPRASKNLGQEIGEGLRYVVRTPAVFLMLSLLMIISIFVFNYNVTIPLLARKTLGLEATGYGALMSAIGGGALIGALTLAWTGKKKPALQAVVVPALVLTLLYLAVSGVHSLYLAMAMLVLVGFSQILFTSLCNTSVQVSVPDELRGRVMSIYALVFAGVTPLGSFLTGTVTQAYGAPAGFLFGGGLGLVGSLLLLAWWVLRGRNRVLAAQPGAD